MIRWPLCSTGSRWGRFPGFFAPMGRSDARRPRFASLSALLGGSPCVSSSLPAAGNAPPPGQGWSPDSLTGLFGETSGLPGSWGTFVGSLCSQTPAQPPCLTHSALRCCLPRISPCRPATTTLISGLHHTARPLAVYASRPSFPAGRTTAQDSLPAGGSPLAGRDFHPQGPFERFLRCLRHRFPLSQASPGAREIRANPDFSRVGRNF